MSTLAADATEATRRTRIKRGDIQGLRGLAVLLVVAEHAGVPHLGGGYVGVDVFFAVSGYVITRSLLRGRRTLISFWAARARRILPMATVALVVTMLAGGLLLNLVRAGQVARDAMWAGVFAANVHFAALGTDYFAGGRDPSPVQHFWSLAVEEQFYLVWPLALAALGAVAVSGKRRGPLPLGRIWAVLAGVVVLSLAWSVWRTGQQPAAAYFSTGARAWEIGTGALLAVAVTAGWSVPDFARPVLSWLGLALIGFAALTYGPGTAFPGWAALLPVLGTVGVLAAGSGGTAGNPLLEWRPLRSIGDVSYSYYLWHWPVLVLAAGYAGHALSPGTNLVLMAGALALAYGTYRLVEWPFQRSPRLRRDRTASLLLWPAAVAVLLAVGLTSSSSLQSKINVRAAGAAAAADVNVGPAPVALSADPAVAAVQRAVAAAQAGAPIPADLRPAPDRIGEDIDTSMCIAAPTDTSGGSCRYGARNATRTLGLLGDSHAMVWFRPIEQVAEAHGWAVVTFLKPGCPPVDVTVLTDGRADTRCDAWRDWAVKQAAAQHLDRVVLAGHPAEIVDESGTHVTDRDDINDRWQAGTASIARDLAASGADVTVLGDVPGLDRDPTDCLLGRRANQGTCTYGRDAALVAYNAAAEQGAGLSSARYVDPVDWFCAEGQCPTVIGGMVAYADTTHVSRTYAATLAPALGKALRLG